MSGQLKLFNFNNEEGNYKEEEKVKVPVVGTIDSKTGKVNYYNNKNKMQKDKIIKVESFSEKGKFYEVNLTKKTCTCPAFQKSGKVAWCKHLGTVMNEQNDKKASVSLLKSNLQKAIRRNNSNMALKTAKALLEMDEMNFLRRFIVIIFEDVILHPSTAQVVDILKKRMNEELSNEDRDLILRVVYDLAECEVRDEEEIKDDLIIDWSKLDEGQKNIISAILFRSKIGGMGGDMLQLKYFSKIWEERFINGFKAQDLWQYLKKKPTKPIKFNEIGELKKKDILLEAVDFHCSPLLRILLKKPVIVTLIKNEYPNSDEEAILKSVIWRMRSCINYKVQINKGTVLDPFTGFVRSKESFTENDKEKYKLIYNKIQNEVDNISRWFLDKMMP